MFQNFRKYPRYSLSTQAVIRRRDLGTTDGLSVQVNTISQGGMGFYSDAFLAKTTPVAVEFLSDSLKPLGILEGRIASVHTQNDDFFMGIAFDREIPHDHFSEVIH